MCSVNFSDDDDFFVVVLKLTLLIWDKPFHPLCWIHFNQCKVLFAVRYFKFNEYVRFCLIFNLRQNFLRIKIYFEELNMEKITYSEYYAVSVFSELGVHGLMFYVIFYLFWDLVNPCDICFCTESLRILRRLHENLMRRTLSANKNS